MDIFENAQGKSVLLKMAKAIQEKKAYLGEVDGLIGDGDHGMNMNKGFRVFEERIKDRDIGFVQGLGELGEILFDEIGGSMGPIYGTLFMDASEAGEGKEEIGTEELAQMLEAGLYGLYEIVEARVGDKTMVDTLAPAVASLKSSVKEGVPLGEALIRMESKGRGRERFNNRAYCKIRTFQQTGRAFQGSTGCRRGVLLYHLVRIGGRDR